jgi:hypothetical protein
VERPPRFLHGLDPQDPLEVLGAIVIVAANSERCGDEAFLNVVANRASRHASETPEIADGLANGWRHVEGYMTVTVALSTGAF